MKESELRVGLLISGEGTTAEAVIRACQEKHVLRAETVAVIASRTDAGGIKRARELGIENIFVVPRKEFLSVEAFGEELLKILKELDVDLVSQNGWLIKTPLNIVEEYKGKIINQHPGPLDPERGLDFGGKGMYGARVTCARLAYEWLVGEENPWTESTVHHVTEEYDQGALIRVVEMEIPSVSSPVTIAELQKERQLLIKTTQQVQVQLLPLEHENVITVLQAFAEGEKLSHHRPEALIPKEKKEILSRAKNLAIEVFP